MANLLSVSPVTAMSGKKEGDVGDVLEAGSTLYAVRRSPARPTVKLSPAMARGQVQRSTLLAEPISPVTGFAGDAPRIGAEAQSHFAGGLDDQITILAGLIAENASPAAAGERRTLRERAISLHCQMLGALVLSRSVAQATPALSNEILENVKRDVLASLDQGSSHAVKPRKKH
jgi:hypothetical protein